MPIVTVLPHGFSAAVRRGGNLFDAIDAAGRERGLEVFPLGLCGGKLQCCQCGVVLVSGEAEGLSRPYPREKELVAATGYPAGSRLTCVSRVRGDVIVLIPDPAGRKAPPAEL
jgi:ferredoxin